MKDKPIYPDPRLASKRYRDDLYERGGFENSDDWGMTLLEHYAGLAMQGILAHQTEGYGCSPENGAKLAVRWSKALIEELKKQSNDND